MQARAVCAVAARLAAGSMPPAGGAHTQCSDSVAQLRTLSRPRLPAMSSSGAPLCGSTDHLHAKNSSSFCACRMRSHHHHRHHHAALQRGAWHEAPSSAATGPHAAGVLGMSGMGSWQSRRAAEEGARHHPRMPGGCEPPRLAGTCRQWPGGRTHMPLSSPVVELRGLDTEGGGE